MGDVVSGWWDGKKGEASNTGDEEPPGDHPMEARVAALEKVIPEIRERLVRVETKLDSVEKNMATTRKC